MNARTARPEDVAALTALWHDGWQEAHGPLLPVELARHRTPAAFRARLVEALAEVRVVGPVGDPVGLCIVHNDELNQLYVSERARGTGVAATLLADAEARFIARGITTAWLACAIGNDRAARFYEKHRWHRTGIATIRLYTPDDVIPLDVWRYEKAVTRDAGTEVQIPA